MLVAPMKLKIKFPAPGPQSCEFRKQLSAPMTGGDNNSDNSIPPADAEKANISFASTVGAKRHLAGGDLRETFSENGAKRHRPEEMMDSQHGKRQKMDRAMTFRCTTILKKLMSNPWSHIFNKPVDPVALSIPDYFSVITNPMDLGTVKSKLDKNAYFGIEEFAADIRLTVSNAILYNPPDNIVHKYAKELSVQFETRWKALGGNSRIGKSEIEVVAPSRELKRDSELRQNGPKTPQLRENSLPSKSNISGEKMNVECDANPVAVNLHKPVQRCTSNGSGKILSKGSKGGHARVSTKAAMDSRACKCSTCGSLRCQCNLNNDSSYTSSSDVTLERDPATDASKLDGLAKSTLTSRMKKSDPDSDGVFSAFDDWMTCQSSEPKAPSVDAAVSEEQTTSIPDVPLSPSKALRAAIIKSRFAEAILKAKKKTLYDHADKVDPIKIQKEKEQLKRMQLQEKAKIEAQIRAAEAAAKMKAETELKERLERDREAARIALQKVEKSVELEQNLEILRELETLCGSHQNAIGALKGADIENPLQRLGLFIKDDDYLNEEDEEEAATLIESEEEGEIL